MTKQLVYANNEMIQFLKFKSFLKFSQKYAKNWTLNHYF